MGFVGGAGLAPATRVRGRLAIIAGTGTTSIIATTLGRSGEGKPDGLLNVDHEVTTPVSVVCVPREGELATVIWVVVVAR